MRNVFIIFFAICQLCVYAQRSVHIFSHDTLTFAYASSPQLTSLLIQAVPDTAVKLVFRVNEHFVIKHIPYGNERLTYVLRPGNDGIMGLWYRGTTTAKISYTIDYVSTEQQTDSTHMLGDRTPSISSTVDSLLGEDLARTQTNTNTKNQDTVFSNLSASDTNLTTVNPHFDSTGKTTLSVEYDLWIELSKAAFEYDRVRILRDYFTQNNCQRADIFKALKALRYDPSRLELCKHLSKICIENLREWQSDISDAFFVYPHFKHEFNNILK